MSTPLFSATIAGSLPKPAWLSETQKLWPQWKAEGAELAQAKQDATLLWIKAQEDAGLDVIGDGEQSRQHFVHGFLEQVEGIDFEHKVKMGIRDNRYDAMVPQVVSALKLKGRVHAAEAQLLRAAGDRRSWARDAWAQLQTTQASARHAQDVMLPLLQAAEQETLLRYNGMLQSTWDLLAQARERLGALDAAHLARRDFWLAHTAWQALLAGGDYQGPGTSSALGGSASTPPKGH